MFLRTIEVGPEMRLYDIVNLDYRTASVFEKYGLSYSETSRLTLRTASTRKKIDPKILKLEVERAMTPCHSMSIIPFNEWPVDFLVEYIIHIHHHYLRTTFLETGTMLQGFLDNRRLDYPGLDKVDLLMDKLKNDIIPHIRQEENSIFPYIKQVARAYENKESFAKLLVKTLGKPIESIMRHEQNLVSIILEIRKLTGNYGIVKNTPINLKVILCRLKEFDYELIQHIHLENEVLFPKIIRMEQDLLK